MFEFRDFLILQGIKAPRIEKHLDNLERVLKWLGKDADKATNREIEVIVARITRSRKISDGQSTTTNAQSELSGFGLG